MLANRIGLVLAMLGAAAIMAAALLVRIVDGGWILIASPVAVAASALWVSRSTHRDALLPLTLFIVTGGPVLASVSIRPGSLALFHHAMIAAGLVLTIAGFVLLAHRPAATPTPSEFRSIFPPDSCPGCTHPVEAVARTCNNCGFTVKRYRRR